LGRIRASDRFVKAQNKCLDTNTMYNVQTHMNPEDREQATYYDNKGRKRSGSNTDPFMRFMFPQCPIHLASCAIFL